jgi:phage-related protein
MARRLGEDQPKPVRWVGSSKEDLSEFPADVRRRVGGALWEAQIGRKAAFAKPLRGFGDAGVLETVDDFDGDTFRAVYTVRFVKAVYVLVDRILAGVQARIAYGARRGCRPGARGTQSCALSSPCAAHIGRCGAASAFRSRSRCPVRRPGRDAPLARRAVAVRVHITERF